MSSAQDSGEILIKNGSFVSEVTFELKLVHDNLYPPFMTGPIFYYTETINLRRDKTVWEEKDILYEKWRNLKKFWSGNQAAFWLAILQTPVAQLGCN
jgi:hypothetical protein